MSITLSGPKRLRDAIVGREQRVSRARNRSDHPGKPQICESSELSPRGGLGGVSGKLAPTKAANFRLALHLVSFVSERS